MAYALQLAKMIALATLAGLVASRWLSLRDCLTVGVAAFWLLTVRVS